MEMRYIPHTDKDIKEMLDFIGISSIDELFADIPPEARYNGELRMERGLSELELRRNCEELAATNRRFSSSFLGAGAYRHFIPSVVRTITSRSEFYTAYTPYQAEASQGTLQAIYEFQSFICLLTGMDVANASLYDGATAVAEAALLAQAETRRKKLLLSAGLHPEYRQVLTTYCTGGKGSEIGELAMKNGQTDLEALKEGVDKETAAVIIQNPCFFGTLEPLEEIAALVKESGALLVVVVAEPMSLGILKTPGSCGADVVVGDCQSFGIPLAFGGPHLGFMGCKSRYMRKIPGRLAGKTVDKEGKEGFVLTLQAREQHIRRDKAASNICTNEALCALAATVYLSLMGKKGLREVAEQNTRKAHYACGKITSLKGYSQVYSAPFFNEFLVRCPQETSLINRKLEEARICGGLPMGRFYPDMRDCMLFCVTELNRKEEIDDLAELLHSAGETS
jgi:glycine dehydrogenase subunit 1